jgi:hypothetical protein
LWDEPEEHSWDREVDRLRAEDERGDGMSGWPENAIKRLDVYLTSRLPRTPFAELSEGDQDYLLALASSHSAQWAVNKYLRQKRDEAEAANFVADCEARLRRINEHHEHRPR